MKKLLYSTANASNSLQKLLTVVAALVVIGFALMFSLLIIAIVLVAGVMAWGYFWWKSRKLRKLLRSYPSSGAVTGEEVVRDEVVKGQVFEGEVIRVVETLEVRQHS